MLKPIIHLENQLAALIQLTRQLQADKQQLLAQVTQLEADKLDMHERMRLAQERINRIIDHIEATAAAKTGGNA